MRGGSCGAEECPHAVQNFASAGRGVPQLAHATTAGDAATGRPQFPQKCEPDAIGAPHKQRAAGAARRDETATASNVSSS